MKFYIILILATKTFLNIIKQKKKKKNTDTQIKFNKTLTQMSKFVFTKSKYAIKVNQDFLVK
jgi:hypothetical protein